MRLLDRIPVHSRCARASCWQLMLPCREKNEGHRTRITLKQARMLDRECEAYWTEERAQLGDEKRRAA